MHEKMKQTCRRCKKDKDISEFHKDKSIKTGHVTLCKTCLKVDNKRYYKVAKLKEYNMARQREKFPDFGRKALEERMETALQGTPSIFQEI